MWYVVTVASGGMCRNCPKKSSSSGLEDTSMGKPVSREVTTVFFAGPSVGSVGRRGLGDGGSVGWSGVRLGGFAPPAV